MEFPALAALTEGVILIALSFAVWKLAWRWRARGGRWSAGAGGRLAGSFELAVVAATVLLGVWGLATVVIALIELV